MTARRRPARQGMSRRRRPGLQGGRDRRRPGAPVAGQGLTYVPRVVITDKLASYGAAMREALPSVEHRRHKGLNNRAENSHQPTRERERRMRRFKDPGHAQRFLAAYGPIAAPCRPRRQRLTAAYRQQRDRAHAVWREVTSVAVAA